MELLFACAKDDSSGDMSVGDSGMLRWKEDSMTGMWMCMSCIIYEGQLEREPGFRRFQNSKSSKSMHTTVVSLSLERPSLSTLQRQQGYFTPNIQSKKQLLHP